MRRDKCNPGRPVRARSERPIQEAIKGLSIFVGGTCDDSKGYFIEPTVIENSNPKSVTMCEEIVGPVLTIHVYPEKKWKKTLALCDSTAVMDLAPQLLV